VVSIFRAEEKAKRETSVTFQKIELVITTAVRTSNPTLSRVRGSVTNNNGFWIGWLDLLALLLQLQPIITAHNQLLPKTRSVPYWTTSVFSSTVTDLGLIYESVTSSASVPRWLTLHSWTLNLWTRSSLTNESEWIHELTLFYNSGRTDERSPSRTVLLLWFVSSVATKRVSISGQRFGFYQRIRCYERTFSEQLPSNGLFRHNTIHSDQNMTVSWIKFTQSTDMTNAHRIVKYKGEGCLVDTFARRRVLKWIWKKQGVNLDPADRWCTLVKTGMNFQVFVKTFSTAERL
jgi:hypothetical protein